MIDAQSYSGQAIWGATDYMTVIGIETTADVSCFSARLKREESRRAVPLLLLRQTLPGQNIPSGFTDLGYRQDLPSHRRNFIS
jgi:hypothetical protein